MNITRRQLVTAKASQPKQVLVCVFQSGAADGLNAVVPYGDPDYYRHRPNIAVPRPGQPNGAIELDGFFGLHPSLQPLKTWYSGGKLALVHACGFPHGLRSHFEAQTLTESGVTDINQVDGSGWIGRYIKATQTASSRPLRAISISGAVRTSMGGAVNSMAIDDLSGFGLGSVVPGYQDTLSLLYPSTTPCADIAHPALAAIDELVAANPLQFAPENGAIYPTGYSGLGPRLKQAAQLIKADLGVEVICIDVAGWDHHKNLPDCISVSLAELSLSLSAFAADLGGQFNRVNVVVMTEFGRRVAENGSYGADHGTAGCVYLFGGGVNGGQVAGKWPTLAIEALAMGEDLAITTDLRGVLVQLLSRRLGFSGAASLFPGYSTNTVVPELFLQA